MFSTKSLQRQVRLIPIALAAIGLVLVVLLYRRMLGMGADALLLINTTSQFALIVIGGAFLVREEWPRRHPLITMMILVLVGSVGMLAAVRQNQLSARETAAAQQAAADANNKLSTSLGDLGRATGEIVRVQELNTQLQKKLLDSSDSILNQSQVITDLSKQAINTSTGGSSFAYMTLSSDSRGSTRVLSARQIPIIRIRGSHRRYSKNGA